MAGKHSNEAIKKLFEQEENLDYALVSIDQSGVLNPITGKRAGRKITVRHKTCGHVYRKSLMEFIAGQRCPKCKGKSLREHFSLGIDRVRQDTEEMTGGEYSFVDDEYHNTKTKHRFRHNTCGTVFEKKYEKFKEGQRCPACTRKGMESVASRYVRDIFDHLGVTYEREKRFSDCINPETGHVLPFDYYLPEINTLIEVDGEQHERDSFSKFETPTTMERDALKDEYAKRTGITLLRIPAKEWERLPEILHVLLSQQLRPTLTLSEVKAIPISTHPERINKDLQAYHNGEYRLKDPYYFGIDREHTFEHLACGYTFTSTVYFIRKHLTPCPRCRKRVEAEKMHKKVDRELQDKFPGRYSLDPSFVGTDEKGRRKIRCHACGTSWFSTVGNLMGGKAGCPTCLVNHRDAAWQKQLAGILLSRREGKPLSHGQNHWLWVNRDKYKRGKLSPNRQQALQKHNLHIAA